MMEVALYLLPVTLGETPVENVLPVYNKEVILGIKHFIVEDVRSARRFLKKVDRGIDIDALTFYPLNKHTSPEDISGYLKPLLAGQSMGVISEAGCPAVADPGADVVAIAQRKNLKVVPLVGPSSIIMSVMGSGFNGQSFAFHGYLPIEPGERAKRIKVLEQRVYAEDQTQLFIETPYRLSPLSFKVGDQEYFNERPISTQQTAFTFVAQMRANLPDAIGGVLWFGTDDANMTVFAPVYCCSDRIPDCYSGKEADCVTFSWDSAFWIYNWVADMIRPRYSLMIDDMRAVQNNLEDTYANAQAGIESSAMSLYEKDPVKAKEFLTNYSCMTAESAIDSWKKLGEFLIVKYNDGAVKKMAKDGTILRPETGHCAPLVRPGYPKEFLEELVKATGERYKMK